MIPWMVRHLISPALEKCFHRDTFRILRELQQTQWMSKDQLDEYRLKKLQRLVSVALNETEYYAEFAGVEKDWQPASLADLAKLPTISKFTLNENRSRLVNRGVKYGPIEGSTGGSSGHPLIFYMDRRRQGWDKAARIRSHEWWNVGHGRREAYIWNSPIELSRNDRVKRFRDWLTNEKLFPAPELCPATIRSFTDGLKKFRPACIYGYPSAIYLMCVLAKDANISLADAGVKVVFTSAEVLYDFQREAISEMFGGAPVADGYGSREAGFIAHQCPSGGMHITDENVIVEILDADGNAVPAGEDGEIVVTQLDNYAMPFIRYRTEDVGRLTDKPCPCGRSLSLMDVVQGRSNDFLLCPSGKRVHSSAVHCAIRVVPGIVTFQLRQSKDMRVKIMLVTDEQFPADGEQRILKLMLERLGPGGEASVEYCDSIAPGPSGKFRYVISELSTLLNRPRNEA